MAARQSNFDMQIKLLLIGDSGVGKTCLLLRYVNDSYSSSFITTIGIDFKIKYIQLDGKRIKLQIWDTAGQERFRTTTTSYFRGTQGVCIVIDLTDKNSFISAYNWLAQLQMHADAAVNIVLIANKIDCVGQCVVNPEDLTTFFNHCGIPCFIASAKDDVNVEIAFLTLATMVKNRLLANKQEEQLPSQPYLPELKPLLIGRQLCWNSPIMRVQAKIEMIDSYGACSEEIIVSPIPLHILTLDREVVIVRVTLRYAFDEAKGKFGPWNPPTEFNIPILDSGKLKFGAATTRLLAGSQGKSTQQPKRFLLTYTVLFQHTEWRPHWVEDNLHSKCQVCFTEYSILTRRHHCRKCGYSVCNKCCPKTQVANVESYEKPVRVCTPCLNRMTFDRIVREARSYPGNADFTLEGWEYLRTFLGLEMNEVNSRTGEGGRKELVPFAEGGTAFVFAGKFNGISVAVKQYKGGYLEIKRPSSNTALAIPKETEDPLYLETSILRALSSCPYAAKLIVESIDFAVPHPFIATEMHDQYGTLHDVLENRAVALPWSWRMLVLCEIMAALWYLDQKRFSHMDLKPENCLIISLSSNRFSTPLPPVDLGNEDISLLQSHFPVVVKLVDFNSSDSYGKKTLDRLLSMCISSTHAPPEGLVSGSEKIELNSAYDMYSFGIVMAEVASRALIYDRQDALMQSVNAFVRAVASGRRPLIIANTDSSDPTSIPDGYDNLVKPCWSSQAAQRPTPSAALQKLVAMLLSTEEKRKEFQKVDPPVYSLPSQDEKEEVKAANQSPLDQAASTDDHAPQRETPLLSSSPPHSPPPANSCPQYIIVLRAKDFQSRSLLSTLRNATNKSRAEQYESKLPGLKAFVETSFSTQCSDFTCSSPGGQFLRNVVYQRHLQASRQYYIPIHEFAEYMLDEKEQEFMGILQALGARSIQLYTKESNDQEIKARLQAGAGNVQFKVEGASNKAASLLRGCLRDFGVRPNFPKPVFDARRNYLFYPREPKWQGLAEARLHSFLQSTKVVFEFNSLEFVSAGVMAKCAELGGLDGNGSSFQTISFSHEYVVEFFTESDYRLANETRVQQYWGATTVLRFLDFLRLSEWRETFAKWAITGTDLVRLLSNESAFEEPFGVSAEAGRTIAAALKEVIAGTSLFGA